MVALKNYKIKKCEETISKNYRPDKKLRWRKSGAKQTKEDMKQSKLCTRKKRLVNRKT